MLLVFFGGLKNHHVSVNMRCSIFGARLVEFLRAFGTRAIPSFLSELIPTVGKIVSV